MTLKTTLKTAILGLKTNKSRAILTILGIVIGITAIILIMSLGQGAQNLILSQIQGLGSNTIIVTPGRQPKGPSDFAQALLSDSLKQKDLDALEQKSNIPTAKSIVPLVAGTDSASYQTNTYRLTIAGTSEGLPDIFGIYPAEGTFFSADDVRDKADVAVIGSKVKDELFGPSDAIGQRIKMKGRSFRVIGVLGKKGQVSFFNFDELAIIPYTTGQQYVFGIKYFHHFIVVADSQADVTRTVEDITQTLRISHDITDPDKDDFNVETPADLANRIGLVTTVLTYFLAAVAGISLLVGGIGIMNIMLVSVTERTREIGLRKAIGATNKDILNQFLSEAVTLTMVGGITGIVLGAIFAYLTSLAMTRFVSADWAFTFPVSSAILGLAVSFAVGLVFGLYPARQAARKSPIEALRYE